MKRTQARPKVAERKRILLVDDHPFLRQGVAQSLNREHWLTVCGEASSAEETLRSVEQLHPDVVITDLTLPGKNGLELIKDLASIFPKLPVIVLTMHDEAIYAERCLRAGARGYLMKQAGPDKLLQALREIFAGGYYFSRHVLGGVLNHLAARPQSHAPISSLTDREFEIFQLLGSGGDVKEIARCLHLSPKTIGAHRDNIRRKLNFDSAAALLRYAVRWCESERSLLMPEVAPRPASK